jgi:3D (Asp-Asp-Asp) domain-containing protein
VRRVLSGSIALKVVATLFAIGAFVFLYEVTMFDSRETAGTAGVVDPTAPVTGARLQFHATAYCKGQTTASGVGVRSGVAAADPALLPVGTVLNVTTDQKKYNGIYTVMDTGPAVQGRVLDLYMWSCHEALAFGRKPVQVTVLRLGWNPSASSPGLVDRLFRRREAARRAPAPPVEGPVPETATPPPDAPPADAVPTESIPNSQFQIPNPNEFQIPNPNDVPTGTN